MFLAAAAILFLMSLQDLKEKKISLWLLILFLLISIFGGFYKSAILIFIILNLLFLIRRNFAYADVLIITGCANFISHSNIGFFLSLIGFFAIMHHFLIKKEEIPMIPSIFLSFLIINFL
jgi:hypothetical protein